MIKFKALLARHLQINVNNVTREWRWNDSCKALLYNYSCITNSKFNVNNLSKRALGPTVLIIIVIMIETINNQIAINNNNNIISWLIWGVNTRKYLKKVICAFNDTHFTFWPCEPEYLNSFLIWILLKGLP